MNGTIKVDYYKGDDFIETKDLSCPQQYDDFIEDIIKNFNLNIKKEKVILTLITDEDDTCNIHSQDELEDYISENNIKEFKFSVEEDKDDSGKGKICGPINSQDLEKLLDLDLFKEEEDFDVDAIMKDMFNDDEYKRKKEEEKINYSKIFNQTLEKSVEELLLQKSKDISEEMNKKISNYTDLFLEDQKNAYNTMMDIYDNLTRIKDDTEEMSEAIKEMRSDIEKSKLILRNTSYIDPDRNQIKFNDNNDNQIINNNSQMSGLKNNNLEEKNYANPLDGLMNIGGDVGIKFENRSREITVDVKNSKFINIDNISIINVGFQSYKNLIFSKDMAKSSKEINFFGNYKNVGIYELTMTGPFEPNNNANFTISLSIENAKPNQTYKLVIYVKEKFSDKIISEPFEIYIRISQAEDPIEQKQKMAEQIFEELKIEFKEHENLIVKNEIINQLLTNNLDKEEIKNSLKEKIQQDKEEQINQKAEQLYNEFNFYNCEFDKNGIITLIKKENLDKENVQNSINQMVAEKIYNKLSELEEVDIKNVNKDDVLKKIKDLNFNMNELKEAKKKKKIEEPVVNPGRDDDEEVNKLYDELDEEYGISGFIEEDAAKQKIRDFELNRDKIIDWIENSLLSGEAA